MTKLSVNINKVALIRNSRGGNLPDLIKFASDCEEYGADGITVHPRPDERHVRYSDIPALKDILTTEFNIEGYPNDKFMKLVLQNVPDQCTLVPDPPGVLTSNEGWDTIKKSNFLTNIISQLRDKGIRVSLFLDPKIDMVKAAKTTGADRIEFYTGSFAKQYVSDPESAINQHKMAARKANELGLGINAGHDLSLDNLKYYASNIPRLLEVSIGHALVTDSLYFGIKNTIQLYKRLL